MTGTVKGVLTAVGGLAGQSRGTIEYSAAFADVRASESNSLAVGGLVGYNTGRVLSCVSGGDVKGCRTVGGLVGQNIKGASYFIARIENCAAFGGVSGQGDVGGLVGSNGNEIIGCFAGGVVKGDNTTDVVAEKNTTGGLEGVNGSGGAVMDSVAAGRVLAAAGAWGVGGKNVGRVTGCFFDSQSTGLSNGIGGDEQSAQMGLNTSKMTSGDDPGFAESGRWKFMPACYPQPQSLYESRNTSIKSASALASAALFFEDGERSDLVKSSFRVPRQTASREDIIWSSEGDLAAFYAEPGDDDRWRVIWSGEGEVRLVASVNDLVKRFPMKVVGTMESQPGWKSAGAVTASRPVISYNAHGGSPEPPRAAVAWEGKAAAPKENPTKPGYGFGGWFSDEAYDYRWNFDTDTVSEDITLHAKWFKLLERPENLTATPGDGQVFLKWDIPSGCEEGDIIGYEVTSGNFEESKEEVGPRMTSYVAGGLKNGTEYTLKVRAVNDFGPGEPAEARAIPSRPPVNGGGTSSAGETGGNKDEGSSAIKADPGDDVSDENSGVGETGADTEPAPDSGGDKSPVPGDQSSPQPSAPKPDESPDLGVSITVGGDSYRAPKQADGSYLIVLSPGSSNVSIKVGMDLPPGTIVTPDISFPMDFSNGPVTFVITLPDGRMTTARIAVEVAQRHNAKDETVSEDGSLWTLSAIQDGDASYQTAITAPLTGNGAESFEVWISGISVVAAETARNYGGASADLYPRLLRISGKASSRASLESIRVNGISFLRSDQPGLRFEQEFVTPVTYESIGVKYIIYGSEASGGGCSATLKALVPVWLLLAGTAILRRRR